IVRPLLLEYPDDPETWNLADQYLWGDAFLIAPILSQGAYSRDVYLPDGTWIDFWDEAIYPGTQTVTVSQSLSRMPIFIKAGSVIPRTPPRNFVLQHHLDTLLVDIYPANRGVFSLYEDDGQTLAYRNGEFALTTLGFDQSGSMLTLSVNPSGGSFSGQPAQRTYLYRIHLADHAPDSVAWNGQLIPRDADSLSLMDADVGWAFQPAKNQLLILGDSPTSQTLVANVYGFSSLNQIQVSNKIPTGFVLRQNYPNPFNPSTTIEFELPRAAQVSLVVYNILGEEVETMVSERLNSGIHRYTWEATDFPSGLYIYRLKAGKSVQSRKMVLLR
ncbi:MAG: DUF5110 domain-containing protein, partial [Gammaproteobacteria bacterium]|nr:DUF5110 domain-containing protein [Gammaproteobacteria bacterium]NIX01123.1 DUF5110 domain-containing protein [Phycisphaerae bacterium]